MVKKTSPTSNRMDGSCVLSSRLSPTSHAPSTLSRGCGQIKLQPTHAKPQLIGDLVDSYAFKGVGVVKKTICVAVQDATYHLVSQYTVEDVLAGALHPPLTFPLFSTLGLVWN